MTTAVALEHVIYCELLWLSGVGVGMQSITLDGCHVGGQSLKPLIMPKNTMVISLLLLYFMMSTSLTCALPVAGWQERERLCFG